MQSQVDNLEIKARLKITEGETKYSDAGTEDIKGIAGLGER